MSKDCLEGYTLFYISNTFISNTGLKLVKNPAKVGNYTLSSFMLSSKTNVKYSKTALTLIVHILIYILIYTFNIQTAPILD